MSPSATVNGGCCRKIRCAVGRMGTVFSQCRGTMDIQRRVQRSEILFCCLVQLSVPSRRTCNSHHLINLSWSNHYDRICSKSYKALYVIRRNVPFYSSIQLKKQLYLTLVKSKISYCCQLWRPHLVKDIQSLERVQRRATKYILQDYSYL